MAHAPTTGFIYGLVASDEPLQIRYVGKTITAPILRLKSHLNGKSARSKRLRNWHQEVRERGAETRLRILGEYLLADLRPS